MNNIPFNANDYSGFLLATLENDLLGEQATEFVEPCTQHITKTIYYTKCNVNIHCSIYKTSNTSSKSRCVKIRESPVVTKSDRNMEKNTLWPRIVIITVLPEISSRLPVSWSVIFRNRAVHAGCRFGCQATGAVHMFADAMREGHWNPIRSGGANCAPWRLACFNSARLSLV